MKFIVILMITWCATGWGFNLNPNNAGLNTLTDSCLFKSRIEVKEFDSKLLLLEFLDTFGTNKQLFEEAYVMSGAESRKVKAIYKGEKVDFEEVWESGEKEKIIIEKDSKFRGIKLNLED